MVMLFGLTNSLVAFQAIMNHFLRDMIEAEDVAVFIDDVIVGMETEEGHNDIVEEIFRRMVENSLFVKLEKCVWKIREIGLLGVMIGPDGIKMERKKLIDGLSKTLQE